MPGRIPPGHDKILSIIEKSVNDTREATGKQDTKCYLVGGYVRDYLLGKEPHDIDCVCSNLDDISKSLEHQLASKKIQFKRQVYQAFGTVLYHFLDENVEFVVPRKESYRSGSRNPDVFIGTFEDDAFRRDFTVNAIYLSLNPEGYLEPVDLTGRGLDDLKNMVLDTPVDPDITFNEDPLRMMRAARFVARGFIPSQRIVDAARRNASRLSIIVPERIIEEIDKASSSSEYFTILHNLGLLFVIFPELRDIEGLEQNPRHHAYDVLTHTLGAVSCLPPKMKYAGLYHDAGKTIVESTGTFHGHDLLSVDIARQRFKQLRLSKAVTDYSLAVIKNHMRVQLLIDEEHLTDRTLRRFSADMGDLVCDLFVFARCDIRASGVHVQDDLEKVDELENRLRTMQVSCPVPQKIAVSGRDVMQLLGMTRGSPVVGKILADVEQKVIDLELPDEKGALLDYIVSKYKNKGE